MEEASSQKISLAEGWLYHDQSMNLARSSFCVCDCSRHPATLLFLLTFKVTVWTMKKENTWHEWYINMKMLWKEFSKNLNVMLGHQFLDGCWGFFFLYIYIYPSPTKLVDILLFFFAIVVLMFSRNWLAWLPMIGRAWHGCYHLIWNSPFILCFINCPSAPKKCLLLSSLYYCRKVYF